MRIIAIDLLVALHKRFEAEAQVLRSKHALFDCAGAAAIRSAYVLAHIGITHKAE